MNLKINKPAALLIPLFLVLAALVCAYAVKKRNPDRSASLPPVMLWAWERPEDLSFLDTPPDAPADRGEIGVAFLAKTIGLHGDQIESRPRLQPLKVPAGTMMMAVVRIETAGQPPDLEALSRDQLIREILEVTALAQVSALQIDFDARKSEREFYRQLIGDLRSRMPALMPLSMTALASWCLYDGWFRGMPVDEVVPMLFRMGADTRQVRNHLESGLDFNDALSRRSFGVSTDEPMTSLPAGRRVYLFSEKKWTPETLSNALGQLKLK